MASIRYEHISKSFGDVVAVDDLDIEIPDKSFLVFVGPSGCGKTTSLRMLAGLEEPSEGNIYIGDQRVNDMPAKDRDIAMVFQSYALYPHMTVYRNMAFSLELRKTPKDEITRRVHQAAEMLGIEDLLDRRPRQLSGGQAQRVAVGRAIVREPVAFLMDEPLSNLDAKLRVQARAQISKLHSQLGVTFVYVTHDQTEAMTMGTNIAVMNNGSVQQLDKPQIVYEEPANVFVAGFIGSPAMNFMDGTLIEKSGKVAVDAKDFVLNVPDSKAAACRPYMGKEVIVGIRPDDTHDPDFAPPGITKSLIKARVDLTELMGDAVFVYLVTDNNILMGRFDPRTKVSVGNTTDVVFNLDRM
ncbi:MAG: ABC transporter ATP-binding protein, partial [Anaerolineales bacterium]